jgi:hypothetical protein
MADSPSIIAKLKRLLLKVGLSSREADLVLLRVLVEIVDIYNMRHLLDRRRRIPRLDEAVMRSEIANRIERSTVRVTDPRAPAWARRNWVRRTINGVSLRDVLIGVLSNAVQLGQ